MKISSTSRLRAKLAGSLLAGTMLVATILAGSTAAQAAPPTAPAQPAVSAFAPITNVGTGLCVQAQFNAESPLLQATCDSSLAQRWIVVAGGNNNGNHIINQLSGLCIYMNGPVASGSPIIQTDCTTVTNEDWKTAAPPAVTTIMSRAGRRDTNLCLAPEALGAGALLRILTCNGARTQLWVIGV
jgi:hypothetical protein